mmetsp:Transcript_78695/g.218678  ORF Transcript_78695/g.218678 Transcript_78695/m.218678 type:complete len:409 (-) Transcript_78695:70-1296(-)
MLQLKYDIELDTGDFVHMAEEHCAPFSPGAGALRTAAWVARLNAWPDLHFRSLAGDCALILRLDSRELLGARAFDELRREVRLMPGTARAVAVLRAGAAPASDARRRASQAVAVFRADYVDSSALVGRCPSGLVRFTAGDLLGATIVDPHMARARWREGQGVPPLRLEFASLGAWLLPQEAPVHSPHAQASARAPLWQAPQEAQHLHAPQQEWMRRLRVFLERGEGEAMLQELLAWLSGRWEVAVATRAALVDAGLAPALVACARRAEASVAVLACRAIGLACRSSAAASAFGEASALAALAECLRGPGELRGAAALAVRELEEGLAAGAPESAPASMAPGRRGLAEAWLTRRAQGRQTGRSEPPGPEWPRPCVAPGVPRLDLPQCAARGRSAGSARAEAAPADVVWR